MSNFMLTTIDNPFNPHTQWDEWSNFDHEKGYNSMEYLARVARTSPTLSNADNDAIIDDAINEIIENDVFGIYIRVSKDDRLLTASPPTGEGGV